MSAVAPLRTTLGAGLAAASLVSAGAASMTACSGPPPDAPSPVIVATPTAVCLNDDYKTPITLDGTQSSPTLTLVPSPPSAGAPALKFSWTLTGSAYRIVSVDAEDGQVAPSGTLMSDKLTVTIAGDQPLQVDLNVVNTRTGGSADTTATIAVTPPNDAGDCPLGNPG
jgi:hypothetical protein